MSLGISIITDEGVVMTAESLGTLLALEQQEIISNCKKCNKDVKPNLVCADCGSPLGQVPPIIRQFPTSQTYYCQKLFKLNSKTGLIVVGNPNISNIKIQNHVYAIIDGVKDMLNVVDTTNYFIDYFKDKLSSNKGSTEMIISGIDKDDKYNFLSKFVTIVNSEVKEQSTTKVGIAVAGVHDILDKMFEGGGIKKYPVKEFPLQDAVEFAFFLMNTQIGVDKYSNRIPRVGGDIDIAVIHPLYGFKWVNQKKLQTVLEKI